MWEQAVTLVASVVVTVAEGLAFFGEHRWVAAVVVCTVALRLVLLPLANRQVRAQRAVARLRPEVDLLRKRFGADARRMLDEQRALYRREGVNAAAPVLAAAAQAPFLIVMYHALRKLIAPLVYGGFGLTTIPFFGLGNLAVSASASPAGLVVLVAMTLANYLFVRVSSMASENRERRFAYVLQTGFVGVAAMLPGVVALYWTVQTLFLVAQHTALRG